MAGFDNNVMYASNVDFTTGTHPANPTMLTDGQLLIANTAGVPSKIQVGTLTSTGGTIVASYSAPNINLEIAGAVPSNLNITVDASTAPGTNPVLPTALGNIIITGAQVASGAVGANVIRTDSLAANAFTIEIQRSTAVAASASINNGVSHFDSADFTVDGNGFVSLVGTGGITWNLITADTIGLTNNGYIAVSAGGALNISLPATSAVGDIFRIALDGATSWKITQAAGQQIRFGSLTTTLGVGGSITSTAQGDALELVCRVANTTWTALSSIGNLTVT